MKANELMIGDWIQVPPTGRRKMKITQLCEDWGDMDDIGPIPLTPEILEKNGFNKEMSEDGIHYRFSIVIDGVLFSIKYALSVFQWLGPLDFKYIHELQHALKLCGIEKEIEL